MRGETENYWADLGTVHTGKQGEKKKKETWGKENFSIISKMIWKEKSGVFIVSIAKKGRRDSKSMSRSGSEEVDGDCEDKKISI